MKVYPTRRTQRKGFSPNHLFPFVLSLYLLRGQRRLPPPQQPSTHAANPAHDRPPPRFPSCPRRITRTTGPPPRFPSHPRRIPLPEPLGCRPYHAPAPLPSLGDGMPWWIRARQQLAARDPCAATSAMPRSPRTPPPSPPPLRVPPPPPNPPAPPYPGRGNL
jgi:hypothetical protein